MSYKTRSLVYFLCLVVAVFAYNEMDNENVTESNANAIELNEFDNVEQNNKSEQYAHLVETE